MRSEVEFTSALHEIEWASASFPESAITCDTNLGTIESEGNVEIKRVLIERHGSQQFLLDTGAKICQHDKFGSLYVKEAVAWSFGMTADEYDPLIET